jgi:hypothetical protein
LLRNIASGLRSLFRWERLQGEFEEELRGFLEMATEEQMKLRMSRKDALRAVRLERGSLEVTKEVVRAASLQSVGARCGRNCASLLACCARILPSPLSLCSRSRWGLAPIRLFLALLMQFF